MLRKPTDWDKIEGIEYGDYETLELGGHEVVIKNAYEYTGQTGTTSLKVEVDISGIDKQAGYYQKQYDSNISSDRKWPSSACKYISLKEDANCVALFKGFTTAVENSNPGYKWNFDEKTLIGKKLCGVFGLEEFEKQDGTIETTVKLTQFRSLDKLKDVKIPKVKLLNNTYMDIDDYEEYKQNRTSNSDGSVVLTGDEVDKFIDDNLLD